MRMLQIPGLEAQFLICQVVVLQSTVVVLVRVMIITSGGSGSSGSSSSGYIHFSGTSLLSF